jgi:hypothetical protein
VGRCEGVQMVMFSGADVNDEGEEYREDDEAGGGEADGRADVVRRVRGDFEGVDVAPDQA